MININRCKDIHGNVDWVAFKYDGETKRSLCLYVGQDVNGAIDAAVAAGDSLADAKSKATTVLQRVKNESTNDLVRA